MHSASRAILLQAWRQGTAFCGRRTLSLRTHTGTANAAWFPTKPNEDSAQKHDYPIVPGIPESPRAASIYSSRKRARDRTAPETHTRMDVPSDLPELPAHLAEEVRRGNVIAFVGAGFSAAAHFPRWGTMLEGVLRAAQSSDTPLLPKDEYAEFAAHVRRLIARSTADSFDRAAQMMEDALGVANFERLITAQLKVQGPLPADMQMRLWLLQQIPFRAIITTNFDPLLPGHSCFHPDRAFRDVLRPRSEHGDTGARSSMMQMWRTLRLSSEADKPTTVPFNVPVIKIHGSVDEPGTIVTSRRAYRKLLYHASGYQTFLKSALATSTILYLGFSFTDGYLNELRSEVLSMLDGVDAADARKGDADGKPKLPIAYAVINDQSTEDCTFLRVHEGVHVLTWDANASDPDPRKHDWHGLDRYLHALYAETNPMFEIGRMLYGKRVLCNEPYRGMETLSVYLAQAVALYARFTRREVSTEAGGAAAASAASGSRVVDPFSLARSIVHAPSIREALKGIDTCKLEILSSTEACLERLERDPSYDVILTNFGWNGPDKHPNAVRLMLEMRARLPMEKWAPVIVFASGDQAAKNRQTVLRAGAVDYCCTFEGVMDRLRRVLRYDDK